MRNSTAAGIKIKWETSRFVTPECEDSSSHSLKRANDRISPSEIMKREDLQLGHAAESVSKS
jgi:hypothetical protein